MLTKILTGGEPGAEQAAVRAAGAFGLTIDCDLEEQSPTGPGVKSAGAEPSRSTEQRAGTGAASRERNIVGSDATLWFGETTTVEAQSLVATCYRIGKPCMLIYPAAAFSPAHVATWIRDGGIKVLNVTGNCEADESGIGHRVERFLIQLLHELGHERHRS